MTRLINFVRRNYRAVRDAELLQVLQSELKYEQSSSTFQRRQAGSLGDFVLEWDAPQSQDVVLRRRYDWGEEIAISALLGPNALEGEGLLPRQALMKVCVKKQGLNSVLQFDCRISRKGDDGSEFSIYNAYHHPSSNCFRDSDYRGPLFSSLDPNLQESLKNYLISRGIGEDLTTFLLSHLHKKEQGQYVSWLRKLEAIVAKET
ncbi:PREDICTED: mitochondrial acidic protein MAM33 [Nelumbo nucifera]|uniref:Mitochondrial acidic protein MAM33 n=2 Tax=Nelumbo nucifera TaxID=4432 RepID=A0A822YF03_NELNU|nr:PREDICTED: mitochondrial acidic protein MAM33 [Nelumbo nucifera]DAD29596.1 TPA_asm: hypothetical protein HUJ06_031064 [Nelumbo nucifera]